LGVMHRSARLFASLSALGAIVTLTMAPAASAATVASLTGFTVNPTQVVGGNGGLKSSSGLLQPSVSGTVTLADLTIKSPLQGLPQPQTVTLSSTNSAVASVPATLSMLPGQSASFPITTTPVSAPTS